jgi:hypothetical protein
MFNSNQMQQMYNELKASWEKHLKKDNVKMPSLMSGGNYTINSLVLVFLYSKLKQKVSKQELTEFLKTMGIESNDVQQARHLAQQSGWYILSGTRGDTECKEYDIQPGEYMLKTIEEPYPSYKQMKRTESLNAGSWDELKKMYNYRCASCGSKENEPNFLYPASKTTLQQGHKDPSKPLTLDNTIPQCPFCNRASRNYFVFDNKGRVEKIYDPQFVLRSEKDIQLEMLKLLIDANLEFAKNYIEN